MRTTIESGGIRPHSKRYAMIDLREEYEVQCIAAHAAATPLELATSENHTPGSSFLATLSFEAESPWDREWSALIGVSQISRFNRAASFRFLPFGLISVPIFPPNPACIPRGVGYSPRIPEGASITKGNSL
jgi:hypothetical protein